MSNTTNKLNRREFLHTGALAAFGLSMGTSTQKKEQETKTKQPEPDKILNYIAMPRKIARTIA